MPERSNARPGADELDRLIDGLLGAADQPGTGLDQASDDLRHAYALLSAARRVRALAAEPVPADVRHRHLVAIRGAAAEHVSPRDAASTGSRWLLALRRRAAAVAAATALLFTATGGGAVAFAQDANPGDPLYGLKRASENVALAVSNDDARLHLTFAERRLEELEAVPDHAPALADAAEQQLGLAQEHGADLSRAGVRAVERLSQVVAQLENDNARIAVSRACARIAEKHGHDAGDCGYDGVSRPGRSGDAPGQQGDRPGRSGDAPGRGGDAPDGSPDRGAADTDRTEPGRSDGAGRPDGAPADPGTGGGTGG